MEAPAARPLYQQIKDRIVDAIDAGEWPPGRKIPSENELVREHGVARMSVQLDHAFRIPASRCAARAYAVLTCPGSRYDLGGRYSPKGLRT